MKKKHKRFVRRSDSFKALADPTRRKILKLLWKRQVCTAGQIAAGFPQLSRPAVSRHLRVLRRAGLVVARGVGREHRYRLHAESLSRMYRDWFEQFPPLWEASLVALKERVESGTELTVKIGSHTPD
jgi:DNA-binding transcriptional ArsR family regulator